MKKPLLFISLSLLIALCIYLFYRTNATVINRFVSELFSEYFTQSRAYLKSHYPLNSVVVYSVPGGLWVFALTIASNGLYINSRIGKLHLLFVPIIISVGLEIIQWLNLTPGRFDWMDVLVYFLFWALAILLNQKLSHAVLSANRKSLLFVCVLCTVFLANV